MKKKFIWVCPYTKFSEFSRDFVDEVSFRIQSAQRAMDVFYSYKDKKPKDHDRALIRETLTFVMPRFAVLEIATLLDHSSKYSLKITQSTHTKKWQVDKKYLHKLMDGFSDNQLLLVHTELSQCLSRHSKLISRIMDTRNEKLAHANVSRYKMQDNHLGSYRFPSAKMEKFLHELFRIIIHNALGFAGSPIEQTASAN